MKRNKIGINTLSFAILLCIMFCAIFASNTYFTSTQKSVLPSKNEKEQIVVEEVNLDMSENRKNQYSTFDLSELENRINAVGEPFDLNNEYEFSGIPYVKHVYAYRVEGYEIFACDLQSRLLMKTAKPFALKTLKKMTDNMETVVYNGYEFYRFGVYAFDQYFYMTALGLDTEVFCIGVVDEHQLDNVFSVFDILLDENSKHAHDNVQL